MDPMQIQQLVQYIPIYFKVADILESTRTFIAIVTSVVVWDWLSTLHLEYRYLWRAKISYFNILVLINRYIVIALGATITYLAYWPDKTVEQCKSVYRVTYIFPIFVYIVANLIMLFRVTALWERNRYVFGGLMCLLVAQIVVQAWSPADSKPMQIPPGIPQLGIPDLHGCFGDAGSSYWPFFLCSPIFDSAIFGLSLVAVMRVWGRGGRSALVKCLLTDGVIWFALSFGVNLMNIIYYAVKGNDTNRAFLGPLAAAIQSISASRMILSLRQAAQSGHISTSQSTAVGTVSSKFNNGTNTTALDEIRKNSISGPRTYQFAYPQAAASQTDIEGQKPWEALELVEMTDVVVRKP